MSKFFKDCEIVEDGQDAVHLPFEDSKCGAAYVDNIGVGGYDPLYVNSMLRSISEHLTSMGFTVHEFQWAQSSA
eukprot:12424113-Karenia_brevis.AAC.1